MNECIILSGTPGSGTEAMDSRRRGRHRRAGPAQRLRPDVQRGRAYCYFGKVDVRWGYQTFFLHGANTTDDDCHPDRKLFFKKAICSSQNDVARLSKVPKYLTNVGKVTNPTVVNVELAAGNYYATFSTRRTPGRPPACRTRPTTRSTSQIARFLHRPRPAPGGHSASGRAVARNRCKRPTCAGPTCGHGRAGRRCGGTMPSHCRRGRGALVAEARVRDRAAGTRTLGGHVGCRRASSYQPLQFISETICHALDLAPTPRASGNA